MQIPEHCPLDSNSLQGIPGNVATTPMAGSVLPQVSANPTPLQLDPPLKVGRLRTPRRA